MTFSFFLSAGSRCFHHLILKKKKKKKLLPRCRQRTTTELVTGERTKKKKVFLFSKLLEKSSNKNGTPNLIFNGLHLLFPWHLLKEKKKKKNLFPYFFFAELTRVRSVQHRVDVLFVYPSANLLLHHLSNRNPLVSPPTSPFPLFYFIFLREKFRSGSTIGKLQGSPIFCVCVWVDEGRNHFLYFFFFNSKRQEEKTFSIH